MKRWTIGGYFEASRRSEMRLEYHDGKVVERSGESYEHSLICVNVAGELGNGLQGTPFHVLGADLRLRAGREWYYCYPDIKVIRGGPEYDGDDPTRHTVINPHLIVEVSTSETEAYDRGERFARYRAINSLQEYILVSSNRPSVEVFSRRSAGSWMFVPSSGCDAMAVLNSIDLTISLSEVYAGVEFRPEKLENGAPSDWQSL